MPKIIVASRYLKPTSKGTRSNLVKYIATRETVQKYSPKRKDTSVTENQKQLIMELIQINPDGKKLPEYSDYLKNPSKENASELLSELLEQSADMIADKEILVKYVAERPGVEKIGKHGLFSDGDDEIILSQAQKNIAEHQGNVWSHVISLTREDAERLGYTTPEIWRNLIMRHTDDIAKAQNIRLENLRWYAAFHNTTHHPHIHLLVYSTDIKEGFLTENGIEQIKSAFANDIFHNELYQVYEKQTAVRDQLRSEAENVMKNLLSELQNNNQFDPQLEQLILKLQSQFRNSKGKKVYGYLQPNVKKTVDQIVAELAKNPVLKKMYDEWCALEQQKYETYTSAVQKFPPLEENKVFKPIKNTVIRAVLEIDNPAPELDSEMFADSDESDLGEAQSSSEFYIKWTAEYKSACSELYKNHDASKAFELIQAEAEKGNILALHDLGKMYRNGLLGDENIQKLMNIFKRLCRASSHLNRPQSGSVIMCSTESEKCMRSDMTRNRTTPKRSGGLKNLRRREISSRNTRSAACIFMGTARCRITRKRLNIISCPPIRITPTLAMKPRKCFVKGLALKMMRSKRKIISETLTVDFLKLLTTILMTRLYIGSG